MAKQLLFPQLTREHAIQLDNMVNDYTSDAQREEQVHALELCLLSDGLPFGSRAALNFLRDLAPYTSRIAHDTLTTGELKETAALPRCVHEAYHIMFNALDNCLKNIIKEHWEIEVVEENDPDACIPKYSYTCYDKEEAEVNYCAERLSGEFVRLIWVNEVTNETDVLEVSWMI